MKGIVLYEKKVLSVLALLIPIALIALAIFSVNTGWPFKYHGNLDNPTNYEKTEWISQTPEISFTVNKENHFWCSGTAIKSSGEKSNIMMNFDVSDNFAQIISYNDNFETGETLLSCHYSLKDGIFTLYNIKEDKLFDENTAK